MESTYIVRNELVKRNLINAILDLPIGDWKVEIRKASKTPPQRNLWHKYVSVLAEFTGYTKEQMKHMLKQNVLGLETWKDRKGKTYTAVPSTEQLSKEDYSRLIDETIMIAGKINCDLPPATMYGLER